MKNPYIYDKPEELQKNIDLITELIQKNENVLRKNNAKLQGAYNEDYTEGESDYTEEQDCIFPFFGESKRKHRGSADDEGSVFGSLTGEKYEEVDDTTSISDSDSFAPRRANSLSQKSWKVNPKKVAAGGRAAGGKTYQKTDSLKALQKSLETYRYGNQSPNQSYHTEAKKTGIRQTITQGIMLILCLIILLIFVVIGCSLMIVRANRAYELSMEERAQCDLNLEELQKFKSAFEKVMTSIGKI